MSSLIDSNPGNIHLGPLRLKRVLFSQLKVGETYYEYYTDSRDKFIGFDGYCAIFKQHVFFAYKKCEFYQLVPYKDIVKRHMELRELEKEMGLDSDKAFL